MQTLNFFLFFTPNLYMFYHTQTNVLQTAKLAKKSDTQPNQEGGEMMSHFLSKPHLEQQELKNYHMSQSN